MGEQAFMKSYTDYAHHSVSMVNLGTLTEKIREEHRQNNITKVLETGTFIGLGSTRTLAEAFGTEKNIPEIYTLEANWRNWRKAVKNLQQFSYVNPVWGMSVSREEAIEFVKKDEAIKNPDNFPDIFIDGGDNPMAFYLRELSGEFGNSRYKVLNYYYNFLKERDRVDHYKGEDLLRFFLNKFKNDHPMVVLDSSGAIGLLEFNIVKEVMGDKPFYLLLDDIRHLKHFRSYEELKSGNGFELIQVDEEAGWAFAKKV